LARCGGDRDRGVCGPAGGPVRRDDRVSPASSSLAFGTLVYSSYISSYDVASNSASPPLPVGVHPNAPVPTVVAAAAVARPFPAPALPFPAAPASALKRAVYRARVQPLRKRRARASSAAGVASAKGQTLKLVPFSAQLDCLLVVYRCTGVPVHTRRIILPGGPVAVAMLPRLPDGSSGGGSRSLTACSECTSVPAHTQAPRAPSLPRRTPPPPPPAACSPR
jgi:hypothetical protein